MLTSSTETLATAIDSDIIVSLEHITKSFPGVKALDDISFDIKKQEVLAILGENGAGKSTLMKILSGLYQPDEGQISVNPKWFDHGEEDYLVPMRLTDPRTSMQLGIGMVYQHFQLVEPFTVFENITLGKEFTKAGPFMDDKRAIKEIKKLSEYFGLPIEPAAIVEDLPVGLKQRAEILKQLYRDADLLILDEPTAVLTPTEADELFNTIRQLRKRGKSIIFITHKLKEPLAVADRIIVLRKGKYVGEILPEEATQAKLAEMVVGRRVIQSYERMVTKELRKVLEITELSLKDQGSKYLLDNLNFEVRTGEIVGVAGVQGNGQRELVETLVGLRRPDEGFMIYEHHDREYDLANLSTVETLNLDIAYIPEDRTKDGLVLNLSLPENVWLAYHGYKRDRLDDIVETEQADEDEDSTALQKIVKFLKLAYQKITLPFAFMYKLTSNIIDQFEVKTPTVNTPAKNLSGGNQQKIVLGREFAKDPRLIIASEPTRGVDIGVMTEVHRELINRRNEGTGILLVSSDLDEILNLSDRIIVMYEGRIVGYGDLDDFTTQQISELMTSGQYHEEERL